MKRRQESGWRSAPRRPLHAAPLLHHSLQPLLPHLPQLDTLFRRQDCVHPPLRLPHYLHETRLHLLVEAAYPHLLFSDDGVDGRLLLGREVEQRTELLHVAGRLRLAPLLGAGEQSLDLVVS